MPEMVSMRWWSGSCRIECEPRRGPEGAQKGPWRGDMAMLELRIQLDFDRADRWVVK